MNQKLLAAIGIGIAVVIGIITISYIQYYDEPVSSDIINSENEIAPKTVKRGLIESVGVATP